MFPPKGAAPVRRGVRRRGWHPDTVGEKRRDRPGCVEEAEDGAGATRCRISMDAEQPASDITGPASADDRRRWKGCPGLGSPPRTVALRWTHFEMPLLLTTNPDPSKILS